MSAAPYETIRDYRRPTRRRHRNTTVDATKVKARPRRRATTITLSFVANQLAVFTAVAVVAFGFSILMGSSLKENARRDMVKAKERTKVARDDMARLRARMDRLSTMAAVDTWARARNFVAPHAVPGKDSDYVVAQLD